MEMRTLGRTGLEVSRLGAGCSWIGYKLSFDEVNQASDVLNEALDAGVNFLDTAACYGLSEEMIGRTVTNRRSEYSHPILGTTTKNNIHLTRFIARIPNAFRHASTSVGLFARSAACLSNSFTVAST